MSEPNTDANANGGGTSGDGSAIDPAAFAAGSGGSSGGPTPDDGFVYDAGGQPVYNKDGSRKRKRGRKAGTGAGSTANNSGKASSAADLKASVDVLAGTLQLLHVTAAAVLKAPELELQPAESESLAKATVNVMEQFDLRPDPKTQALVGLICVAGTVYGPRLYLIQARKRDEAEAARNGSATVVTATGAPAGTTDYSVRN